MKSVETVISCMRKYIYYMYVYLRINVYIYNNNNNNNNYIYIYIYIYVIYIFIQIYFGTAFLCQGMVCLWKIHVGNLVLLQIYNKSLKLKEKENDDIIISLWSQKKQILEYTKE